MINILGPIAIIFLAFLEYNEVIRAKNRMMSSELVKRVRFHETKAAEVGMMIGLSLFSVIKVFLYCLAFRWLYNI